MGPQKSSLLRQFAVLSAVPIALTGVFLAQVVSRDVKNRALDRAAGAAELIARLGVQPLLSQSDLDQGLSPERLAEMDRALHGGLVGDQVARVKIWNQEGRVVYSDDRSILGRSFPASDDLEQALEGRVVSEVTSLEGAEERGERRHGRLLEVYVPIRFTAGGPPAGAFEVYLPYQPVQAAIDQDTWRLFLVLLGGLVLLYATLLPIVVRASSTLRRQAAENERLSLRDPLTGLPNRILFRERAQQAIRAARRGGSRVGVLLLDLDRFKEINDALGHDTGDVLLRKVGPRLEATLREVDTVARLGGDEFGVLLPEVADAPAAAHAARKIRSALEAAFDLGEVAVEVEASIGISLFPDHGDDVDSLMQRADVAMYQSKHSGAGYEVYAAERDRYSPDRLGLVSELRGAIQRGELVLHYQPKAEMATGRVTGVEALVRWRHPERGLLLSDEFIPLAEPTSLMLPLTLHVTDQALRQCRAWRDQGLELSVAVNLSLRNLEDPRLPDHLARLLERWGLEPSCLELEVTESAIVEEPARVMGVMTRLAGMGLQLSIDDFGTGYSSLAYLKRLPVSTLKVDKSFVLGMVEDENDAVIVRSTIDLGRNLGLRVVAEGVETAELWDRVAELGCDVAQGYHISRPVPADQVAEWMARWRPRMRETSSSNGSPRRRSQVAAAHRR